MMLSSAEIFNGPTHLEVDAEPPSLSTTKVLQPQSHHLGAIQKETAEGL